jgi:hypothetical protein
MAEYAGRRQCVRTAARGFSPEHPSGMLRGKALCSLDLLLGLEEAE